MEIKYSSYFNEKEKQIYIVEDTKGHEFESIKFLISSLLTLNTLGSENSSLKIIYHTMVNNHLQLLKEAGYNQSYREPSTINLLTMAIDTVYMSFSNSLKETEPEDNSGVFIQKVNSKLDMELFTDTLNSQILINENTNLILSLGHNFTSKSDKVLVSKCYEELVLHLINFITMNSINILYKQINNIPKETHDGVIYINIEAVNNIFNKYKDFIIDFANNEFTEEWYDFLSKIYTDFLNRV